MKRYLSLMIYVSIGLAAFIWLVKVPVLSYYFSQKLRVPVSFHWISIWPKEMTIIDLKVKNPKEFSSRTALHVEKTKIRYFLKNVFSNPAIMNEIEMDSVNLGVEFVVPGEENNNWAVIGRRIPKASSNRSFIIDKIVLTNLTIVISNVDAMGKTMTRYVERLEIGPINSAKGFPTEKVIEEIFGGIHLDDVVKDVFNPFELLF